MILKFSEISKVEVVFINTPNQPALGAGEPSTCATAAAVANAIIDAAGIRLRQIPVTAERVKVSIGS